MEFCRQDFVVAMVCLTLGEEDGRFDSKKICPLHALGTFSIEQRSLILRERLYIYF